MKYLSEQDVRAKLSMSTCIGLMRDLFTNIAAGGITHKLRTVMPIAQGKLLSAMPGHLPYQGSAGAKIITVYHDNWTHGLPSHQGIVVVFDAETGAIRGLVDGIAVTAIRTAAVSAVATDALARPDAASLALLGAGLQAAAHLEAISLVRKLDAVKVWSIDRAEAERFAARETEKHGITIRVCSTAEEAAGDADIVCTVTSSKTPILEDVAPGTHINAVGACQPPDRELTSALVAKARLFGDSVQSMSNESGDYLFPLTEGIIEQEHLLGELGDVLVGNLPGRISADDVTLFKSLGLAVEDIVCASWLLEQ
ncbi:MAG: ornithine cyclodeaminase family protein [Oscillospiraceae bacterium]|nr:ornithine cyclodeaminase family protein [Oscillospiraceae bacterium]